MTQAVQRFLHSVLDGLTSPVCVLDGRGHIVAVNRAWDEFGSANGGPGAAPAGTDYLAVCDRAAASAGDGATQARRFAERLRRLLDGRDAAFQLEYECHSPTELRWYLARAARIEGLDPPHYVVAHDNITPLKQVQETLRRSEALLLDLAASIPGALFRMARRAGAGWHFVYLSPGVESLFGVPLRQARGDAEALWRCIVAADRPAFDAGFAAAAASGSWEHVCRIDTPEGGRRWIQLKASARPGSSGEPAWTGVMLDVTAQQRLESELQASEHTYRRLFETVPQGVVYQDRHGHITAANPAAQRILGLTLDQMQGRTSIDPRWATVREDGTPLPGSEHPAMVALRTGQPVLDTVMGVARPEGQRVWIRVDATPLLDAHGRVEQVYATFEDITARIELERELQHQARTDFLTGLANRRSLMDRLHMEFERLRRQPQQRFSVLALDLDHFKHVNDAYGHAVGDAVLVHVAEQMRQASRAADLVARSGGEEFTLVLPDTGAAAAQALAERLRERIATTAVAAGAHAVAITVSIGVATADAGDAGIDDVLARADRALYRAKAGGRNRVHAAAA